jgi:hypothetical protein
MKLFARVSVCMCVHVRCAYREYEYVCVEGALSCIFLLKFYIRDFISMIIYSSLRSSRPLSFDEEKDRKYFYIVYANIIILDIIIVIAIVL